MENIDKYEIIDSLAFSEIDNEDNTEGSKLQNMPNITYVKIGEGDEGIARTIRAIDDMVNRYCVDWNIISIAREITRHCPERDKEAEADALFEWVKSNIKFMNDPLEAELLQNPLITLKYKVGDCDDFCILLGSLNKAIGNRVFYVTVSYPGEEHFAHILLMVGIGTDGFLKGYDPADPDSFPGYMPTEFGRMRVWVDDKNYQDLAGFFDFFKRLFGGLKKTIKRAFKEAFRVLRKVGLGGEVERVFYRIAKEFARWEDKMGFFGKLLVLGVKVYAGYTIGSMFGNNILANALGGGNSPNFWSKVISGQGQMAFWEIASGIDNPFRMTREEWKLLIRIGLLVGSIILQFIPGTQSLLLTAAIELVNSAITADDLREMKLRKEEAIEQLKAMKGKMNLELRAQREALAKLEKDVILLEELLEYTLMKEKILEEEKAEYGKIVNDIWFNAQQEVLNYRQKKELELQEYISGLRAEYGVAV